MHIIALVLAYMYNTSKTHENLKNVKNEQNSTVPQSTARRVVDQLCVFISRLEPKQKLQYM